LRVELSVEIRRPAAIRRSLTGDVNAAYGIQQTLCADLFLTHSMQAPNVPAWIRRSTARAPATAWISGGGHRPLYAFRDMDLIEDFRAGMEGDLFAVAQRGP
jgi:hypothetical protein